MIEKYNTKYNLISFILLRKNDEYLADYKYYFNDQSLFQKVDRFIEQRQLDALHEMFHSRETEIFGIQHNPEQNLTNFTNSYNCNLFVYAIRKCLEFESKQPKPKLEIIKILDENNNEILVEQEPVKCTFSNDFIQMLFAKQCSPNSFFLIDGDFPKRNVMHYAATYNCELIPNLILNSKIHERYPDCATSTDKIESDSGNDNEFQIISKQVLTEITNKICEEFKEQDTLENTVADYRGN